MSLPYILDGAGDPLAPAEVVADLQAINPRLGLRYHIGLRAFVITEQWREDDPRREYIKRGEMAPNADFSLLAPVPADIPLDELRGWIAGQLRRVSATNDELRRSIEEAEQRLQQHNDAVLTAKLDELKEDLATSADRKTIDVGKRRTRVK